MLSRQRKHGRDHQHHSTINGMQPDADRQTAAECDVQERIATRSAGSAAMRRERGHCATSRQTNQILVTADQPLENADPSLVIGPPIRVSD